MCLITEQLEPLIAEEDLGVGKVLSDDRFSCFYYGGKMHYEENKLYEIEMEDTDDVQFFGNRDEDYFKKHYEDWKNDVEKGRLRCIGQGFHSFLIGSPSAKEVSYEQNYRATIPKGASYFVGPTGCVVSNAIIVHEKL